MIDPDLARRALAYKPPPPPPAPSYPKIVMASPCASLVTTAHDAGRCVDHLSDLDIAWIGLDTEFRAVERADGPPNPDDWKDPSRVSPISVGAAVFVESTADTLVVHRVAFDVRTSATHAALARLLALPVLFVAHSFRAEWFTVQALGLTFPTKFFCTWLAAKQLNLGRHHRHYSNPAPIDDLAEMQAEGVAEARREHGASLLSLLLHHGLQYRFIGDKEYMQASYQKLAATSPLTGRDAAYVTADAEATGALYPRMRAALEAAHLDHHYDTVELPGALAFAAMQLKGVRVDERRRALAHTAARQAVKHAEEELEHYGFRVETVPVRRVIVNSTQTLHSILTHHNLLHLFRATRKASGYSITRDRLKELRDVHPLLDALYRYRRYATVVNDRLFLGGHVGADGNVHSEIDPLGTGTGRPTYKRPNLVGLGAAFRPVVISDRVGHGITEIDFASQEIFIAAVVFNDSLLLSEVNAGDPYRRMASGMFAEQLPPGHETLTDREFADNPGCRPLRKRAKVLTLGIIYGMGDASIAAKLGVRYRKASEMRARFFERYSGLKAGMARAVRLLEEHGYAETVTGAKRFRGATGLLTPWEKRWAVNTPVQGSAACALKVLLHRLEEPLAALDARVLLAPYDSVLIQHPLDERGTRAVDLTAETMKSVMRELFPGCEPRVDVNGSDPSCWNDEGHSDSIERFLQELGGAP